MIYQYSIQRATASHNRAGCPYLNQAGADAVLDWSSVLAGIDPAALPSELQAELQAPAQIERGRCFGRIPMSKRIRTMPKRSESCTRSGFTGR